MIIFEEFIYNENNKQGIRDAMKVRGKEYELKLIVDKCKRDEELEEWKFDAYIYSCHGDIYDKWWLRNRTNGKSLYL